MSTDKIMRRKQIRTVAVLLVIVLLCGAGIIRHITTGGNGDYAGLKLDKYIDAGDYKAVKLQDDLKDEDARRQQVWNQILQGAEVKKYPKKHVKAYYEKNLDHYEKLAADYGYEKFEDYVKNEFGVEMEAFQQQLTAYAESAVKNDMIVYAIAEKEKITITEEEYEAFLQDALKDAGLDEKEFEAQFGTDLHTYAEEKNMDVTLLQNKVMNALMKDIGK